MLAVITDKSKKGENGPVFSIFFHVKSIFTPNSTFLTQKAPFSPSKTRTFSPLFCPFFTKTEIPWAVYDLFGPFIKFLARL